MRARSIAELALLYWKPVYTYARVRFHKSPDDAKEITQEFFAKAVEKDVFGAYDPKRARFRTFLRTCVERFIMDHERVRRARKRGWADLLQVDLESAEVKRLGGAASSDVSFEAYFEGEWVKRLVSTAIDNLRNECTAKGKHQHWRVFELYDLAADDHPPTYAEVAAKLGLSPVDVMNRLSYARREFRRIVLDTLRDITASEGDFRYEAKAVLGISV